MSDQARALEAQCEAIGWVRPSRRACSFSATPRIGQYFWVDFPHDAYAPEFVGEHPGIVVRAARRLTDTCIIVPVSSTPQDDAKHVHRLAKNPNPKSPNTEAWAVCDHLYTVHRARLRPCTAKYGNPVFPRVDPADLDAIFTAIAAAMPKIAGERS